MSHYRSSITKPRHPKSKLFPIFPASLDHFIQNKIIYKTDIENKVYNIGVMTAFEFESFSDLQFKNEINKL